MSASEAVMGLSEDMNDSNDPEHRKKDGLLTFMTKNLLNPFGFFHGAAQNAEYRKNRKRSKALAKRAVAEVEIDVSLSDINNSLSSKLQSLSINESAPEVDSDEDLERQIHDENINLFPGGNQDAVRNVLDGISPYCESQEFLYQNLQGAGQREIGIEEQEEDATLGFINDIDGIVVMSRNLDFYNFEHKKYQLMTKVIPRDVTSMLKKCRKMVFDHENSDDDASRQPVQQLIWSTRLFAECPVHVFYYTVPDDDDLRQMEGGGFSERQPKSIGCHEIIKQAFAGVIYELGVELRDRRRRLAEQNRSAEYIIENAPMCRTLEASGIVVDCNTNTFVAHESLDVYGEDMDDISSRFQEVFERQMLVRKRNRFAVRFGVLEMGTRIRMEEDVDGVFKYQRPTDLLERIILKNIGPNGFASIHFASTLVSKEHVHLFPKRESVIHPDTKDYVDELGQTRKCQKFPIFGRSDLANVHCTLHNSKEYEEFLHIAGTTEFLKIDFTTETSQVYSNASHMFPSKTSTQGSRISEDKRADQLLPKYYKGGGGGNRCPFSDFIVTRYLLNMLSGKELARMQLLTPLREVIRYAGALTYKNIGIRAETVVNARFGGVFVEGEDEDEACTLLDFVNCKQANSIPLLTLNRMLRNGEVARVEVMAWERYIMGILSPLLCTLLRCIIDHRDDEMKLSAIKLSRVCETVINFLFVGNRNYCGDYKILGMAGCSQKEGLVNMIGDLAIIDFQQPLEEQLSKLYLSWRSVPFRAGAIRDYKSLFFLCFPATIHRSISTNEIYAQYDRASHHAIFLLQKFLNKAPLMESKLAVKLMVLCCFPLMWNIKEQGYRAAGFQVLEPDVLAKMLSNVPHQAAVTTLEHVITTIWQLWNGTCYPIQQARIILNSFLKSRQQGIMTNALLREAVYEMDINCFYIYKTGKYDDQFNDPRDQRRVLHILGSNVISIMMRHGYDIVPMAVLDAFWQYLQQELRYRYNVFDYAIESMPTVYEEGDTAAELRKWLSQVLKPLWEYGNHMQNPSQRTSAYFVQRMEEENWPSEVLLDAIMAALIRQVQQNVWGVSPVTSNNSGLGFVDLIQMRLTEGFAPVVNAGKIIRTFEAAEAMGLIFRQPERSLQYYRDDVKRWWSAQVFRVMRNERDGTRVYERELRLSRNFFRKNVQDPSSFTRFASLGSSALRTFTGEERRRITMFGEELEKAKVDMILQFRGEACNIMAKAMGLRWRDLADYTERLTLVRDPDAENAASAILNTSVFNLTNFLVKYMLTKRLTAQDCTEMLLQIGTELYEQLSSAIVQKWVDEMHCKKSFPQFFDDLINAVQDYLQSSQGNIVKNMQKVAAIQPVRSADQPVEIESPVQTAESPNSQAQSPPPAAELENFTSTEAVQQDAPGAVFDATVAIEHSRERKSPRKRPGRPLPFERDEAVRTTVQRALQYAIVSSDRIHLLHRMQLRSQGPALDNASLPVRKRRRNEDPVEPRVAVEQAVEAPVAGEQEPGRDAEELRDDLMQLLTDTESDAVHQRLTLEEINKKAAAWCDNMIFAINHGSTPGAVPTVCKQLACQMNGRYLPKRGWEKDLLAACKKFLTLSSNLSSLMTASCAPNARLHAPVGGPSHSRFPTDLLNRRSQQQFRSLRVGGNNRTSVHNQGGEHVQVAIERLPASLHQWYRTELSLTRQNFLGDMLNAWENMFKQNVSQRNTYNEKMHRHRDNENIQLQQIRTYVDFLWFQLITFYNQHKAFINRLQIIMENMDLDTLSIEQNLDIASDYHRHINPEKSSVYIPIRTEKNGNCWLQAVAIAFFGHIENELEADTLNMLLRLLIIWQMEKRQAAICRTFDRGNSELLKELINLLESAVMSLSWGDPHSLQLLGMALGRQVVVYANEDAPDNRDGYFVGPRSNRAPITLYYFDAHFMYMFIPTAERRSLMYPSHNHTNPTWL